jgi:hypothetical protein
MIPYDKGTQARAILLPSADEDEAEAEAKASASAR